jgi:hypothetical protein
MLKQTKKEESQLSPIIKQVSKIKKATIMPRHRIPENILKKKAY